MYIIEFLRNLNSIVPQGADAVTFEYRLLCSGELYDAEVITTDWRKSDATRLLVDEPFTLTVCSHPFDDYPQELSLRFQAPRVAETKGRSTSSFYPDDEIARDIASILCLLLRRLITVAAKVREIHPRHYEQEPNFLLDNAIDFVNRITHDFWERKPATVIYGADGVDDIIDYNPPPLGLVPRNLGRLFTALVSSQHAESLVLGARLYSQALHQIEHEADLAYQSLISCAETVANDVLNDYRPDETDMIKAKESVFNMAAKLGLNQEQCKALAKEACSGMSWATRKFTKFLIENTQEDLWCKDDLFHLDQLFCPKRNELESVIRTVYAARGRATHRGQPYPSSIVIGIGSTFPARALLDLTLGLPSTPVTPIPPVVWFERLVNCAINNFVKRITVNKKNAQDDDFLR